MDVIKVSDPLREYQTMASELDEAVRRVLDGGVYVCGPELEAFEAEFSGYLGARYSIGTGNGTDALEIALRSVGCGPGSEVITVANAGGFTSAAARATGATPRFVDVDPSLLLVDLDAVEESLNRRTAAVVVTHLYGQLHPEVERLAEICSAAGVPLIEDCAQAVGARTESGAAGTFGDAAVFSFYPTKNLGALGDGGMLVTDDTDLARTFRSLSRHGTGGESTSGVARNSRLDELQAAVLRVKLRKVDELVGRRRSAVASYRRAAPHRWWAGRSDPSCAPHLAVTRTADRRGLTDRAIERGIATAVRFDPPDHLLPGRHAVTRGLPVTERSCGEVLAFPCHAYLSAAEIDVVCEFLSEGPDE